MATTARLKNEPSVWLGCSHCYTHGRLIGDWYPLSEVSEIAIDNLHDACSVTPIPWCEEVEVFDHNLPVSGEPDPSTLLAWAQAYETVGDSLWPAYCAWISTGTYVENSDGVGDPVTFEDTYCGIWDDFADFIVEQTNDCGFFDGASETLIRYFDWNKWIADCRYDYSVVDVRGEAGSTAIYIFRCL